VGLGAGVVFGGIVYPVAMFSLGAIFGGALIGLGILMYLEAEDFMGKSGW